MQSAPTDSPAAETGLAQALAAALWEAELSGAADPEAEDEPAAAEPVATGIAVQLERLTERLDELGRLGERQTAHVEKLHAENTRLRAGEFAAATAPLLLALVRLADRMAQLAEGEGPDGTAALLRGQLVQVLETAGGVTTFSPSPGSAFDRTTSRGVRAVDTDDPAADGAVTATVRVGFARADGTVLRAAEVEVGRLSEATGSAA